MEEDATCISAALAEGVAEASSLTIVDNHAESLREEEEEEEGRASVEDVEASASKDNESELRFSVVHSSEAGSPSESE